MLESGADKNAELFDWTVELVELVAWVEPRARLFSSGEVRFQTFI